MEEWHKRALPNIRTKEFEETWIDFLHGWDKIKYKIGEGVMENIFKRAAESECSQIAVLKYPKNNRLQILVALCRELQREAGDRPFFLSHRTAGKLFDVAPMTAWRWLDLLVREDILEVIEKGRLAEGRNVATLWKYLPDLKE